MGDRNHLPLAHASARLRQQAREARHPAPVLPPRTVAASRFIEQMQQSRDARLTLVERIKQRVALGHQTITMTMRYSHLAPDHLRAAVAALDGVLAPQADEMPDDTTTSQEVVQQVESQSSRSVVSRK